MYRDENPIAKMLTLDELNRAIAARQTAGQHLDDFTIRTARLHLMTPEQQQKELARIERETPK